MKYEKPIARDLNALSSVEGGLDCNPVGTSASGNCIVIGSYALGTCSTTGSSPSIGVLGDCGVQGLVAGK